MDILSLINVQFIVDCLKSFVYAWIPASVALWWLLSLRGSTKILPAVFGFCSIVGVSHLVAHLNTTYQKLHSPGEESFQFLAFVGLNEELFKFVAVLLGLWLAQLVYKLYKKERITLLEIFSSNFLAIGLAGALGFAFIENFYYGISGKGGLARLVPLVAHSVFAIFSSFGLYMALQQDKWLKKILYIVSGVVFAGALHFIYNSLASDTLVTAGYKAFVYTLAPILLVVLIWQLWSMAGLDSLNNDDPELEEKIIPSLVQGMFVSCILPGLAHFVYRREAFNGLTFLLMGLAIPLALLFILAGTVFQPLLIVDNQPNLQAFGLLCGIVLGVYLAICLWSGWESTRINIDFASSDPQKRFSITLAVSCLLFVGVVYSFLLPISKELSPNENPADPPDSIIKEIPLGIEWEIEEVEPEPRPEKIIPKPKPSPPTPKDTIEISKELSKPKPSPYPQSKGIPNSQSNSHEKMPEKLPDVGYIGIQINEITVNGVRYPYVSYVYPGTSADRAGLKVNDIIMQANGDSLRGLNPYKVSKIIKGPIGSTVRLKIMRWGEGEKYITAYRTGTLFSKN